MRIFAENCAFRILPECFSSNITDMTLPRIFGYVALMCTLLFVSPNTYAQTLWSLEDCLQYGLANNLQIQQGQLNVDLQRSNLIQARANQLPNLNASATHGVNTGRTIDPFTNTFATESVRSNNFGISGGLILFNGLQVRNAINQAETNLEANRHDVEKMENDMVLAITSGFLQILFAYEMLAVANGSHALSLLQVERTRRLVEAGVLARGSLLSIEAQAATDELQVVNAQNRLDLAYLDLAQLLRIEDIQNFRIRVPEIEVEDIEDVSYSPMQIFSFAVNNQPDIRSANLRIASAEYGLKIAKGARSPALSFRGSYGTGYSGAIREITDIVVGSREIGITAGGERVFGPAFDYVTRVKPFRNQLEDNLNRSISFVLTIPILNNLQVNNSISRARISLESAQINQQMVRDQFFKSIQMAHADAKAALKRYHSTAKNVEALEEAFRYAAQKFELGMVNSFEYNDAKNRLTFAKSEQVQAKFDFVFRTLVLDFYMGNPIAL